ncbi:MAG: NifB/NifX family molybdenum-iron cluster-binding protein [Desulfovibrionaceae bacterium]|nr:NifB/NifX family molybdenum-iron cluster-binding protein [Desulfovibrionaceae bacterium]
MILALPTRDGRIDDHFGHCDHYTLMTVDDSGTIVSSERMDSPEGCGCKSDIAPMLAGKGVKVMLAGNMGQGAVNVLTQSGIEVVRGCFGFVEEVAVKWLAGDLADNAETCDHHDCDSHGHEQMKPL